MSHNERGMQTKTDDNSRQRGDNGEFPIVCEKCLGDTPYVRMQKNPFGGNCKMCDRPFTIFKWRPGRGEGYRKTEVCQVCSKIKNLCQTCILDLQFGLPSQLRDSVLSSVDGTVAAIESDVNREHFAQQHLLALESGQDPWKDSHTPNEQLLKIARSAATANREHKRVKLPVQGTKRTFSEVSDASGLEQQAVQCSDSSNSDLFELPLPPGVDSGFEAQISAVTVPGLKSFVNIPYNPNSHHFPPTANFLTSNKIDAAAVTSGAKHIDVAPAAAVRKRPPPGPPPAWALSGSSAPPTTGIV